jgi:hypothetical protein
MLALLHAMAEDARSVFCRGGLADVDFTTFEVLMQSSQWQD